MSTLPSLAGPTSKESNENGSDGSKISSSSLPKLEASRKEIDKSKSGKSPRASRSPRTNPPSRASNKAVVKSTENMDNNKLVDIHREKSLSLEEGKQKHHHHHMKGVGYVPMLARTKSSATLAKEFAEQSWNAREKFVAFVPRKVLPQMPEMEEPGERCTPLQGVVSFLDVAGFTKLTERLALQADGAERLAAIINKLMGQLLGTLKTGDVIKFSGDAILVFYEPDRSLMGESSASPPPNSDGLKTSESSNGYYDEPAMKDAAYRAVSEGLKALNDEYVVTPEQLGNFSLGPDDPISKEGIKLALHVAICTGDLQLIHVGGCFGRWEVLMAGPAMQALGPTADHAPTDHLVIESKTWSLLESFPQGNRFTGDVVADGFIRILRENENHPANLTSGAIVPAHHRNSLIDPASLAEKYVQRKDMDVLLRYVTPVIQRAVCAGTLDAVSGFTDVTVLFIGISGVELAAPCDSAGGMMWGQVIMGAVQACVYDHEGSVNKFVMDDKGALLLCAWGLPPMAHADDPYRALMAALHISAEFVSFGIKAHIGVTTGKVFAGVIGPSHRCEYSLLGDTVNLSARLMGKAPFGGVLCDQATYNSASATGMEFEVLEPIKVKGKEHLQAVFKPLLAESEAEAGDRVLPMDSRNKPKNARSSMWDGGHVDSFSSGAKLLSEGKMRTKEREQLLSILDRLYKGGGGNLVLTGDAGTGKSELAKMVLKSTEKYNSLLIESLTPKKKGLLSEVISKPCIELSQILQGLLSFTTVHASSKSKKTPSSASKSSHSVSPTNANSSGNRIAFQNSVDVAGNEEGGDVGSSLDTGSMDSFKFDSFNDSYEDESVLPKTVNGWKRRLRSCLSREKLKELKDCLDCFDDYFDEWVDESGGEASEVRFLRASSSLSEKQSIDESFLLNQQGSATTTTQQLNKQHSDYDSPSAVIMKISKFDHKSSRSINLGDGGSVSSSSSFSANGNNGSSGSNSGGLVKASFKDDAVSEDNVENPAAESRRRVLTALLDHVLHSSSARPLMIFVHVRTGSSLNVVHPEMWPLLQHLSNYAVARHDEAAAAIAQNSQEGAENVKKPMTPLVVAFTHRRIVDFAGGQQSRIYSNVIANAEKCEGLVQLGPLDKEEREDYLRQTLKVSHVPPEVTQWVSDVANGNPQYIEICAKEVDKPEILLRVAPMTNDNEVASKEKEEEEENGVSAAAMSLLPKSQLNPETGLSALKSLEKPRKIVGFIKQVLGSLGPHDKLVVQVLSLFNKQPNDSQQHRDLPIPTQPVLRKAFHSMANISDDRLEEVLDRLTLYGIIESHEMTQEQINAEISAKSAQKKHAKSSLGGVEEGNEEAHGDEDKEEVLEVSDKLSSVQFTERIVSDASMISMEPGELYYKVSYPLMREMAEDTLLGHQKAPILAALLG